MKPIIPAEKPELLSVAKAMHREDMGSKLQTLFQPELNAAIEAIQTGTVPRSCPLPFSDWRGGGVGGLVFYT